jgi:hypothetical protein
MQVKEASFTFSATMPIPALTVPASLASYMLIA